jgi:hypothetical protein
MHPSKQLHLCRKALIAPLLFAALLITTGATAQNSTARTPQNEPRQSAQQPAAPAQQQAPPETKISPQEAEDLFRSVDEILKFASQNTTLPIQSTVKRRLVNRDEVVAFIEKHMSEDEDAQRLKRSELVLKKFGLLPRDFNLQKFLLALLREQVAGYYDPATKTVNLLDWVDPEQQRPVLAHELTHALQDQSFGLEKWMKAGATDIATSKREPTTADIETDEIQTAHQAVVEGQAMAVLIDYMLAPTGQSLTTSPQIVEALKAGMLVGTADSVQFRNAPNFLKEVMTFPYRYGVDFITAILVAKGKEAAFQTVFKNPPTSSREIMEPKSYLASEKIPPLNLPDLATLTKDYERFDIGAMGEFDVALLVDEFAGEETSHKLYPEWRGGYYYAAQAKGDTSAPLALFYVSRWAKPEIASEFAGIYADSLKRRYHSVRPVSMNGQPGKPLPDKPQLLTGNNEWLTEQGDVVIAVDGDRVFVTESFDEKTSTNLREAVFTKAKTAAGN